MINTFELFGYMDGHDEEIKDQDQEVIWEEWFCDCAIDKIARYYQLRPVEGVIFYKKGDIPKIEDEGGSDEK